MEGESSSSVDDHYSCLFCPTKKVAKNISGTRRRSPAGESVVGLSLTNLFHFLGMGIVQAAPKSDVLRNKFGGDEDEPEEEEVVENMARSICDQCLALANLFGGIYQDYETARLLLHGCVQMLGERVKGNSPPPPEVDGGGGGGLEEGCADVHLEDDFKSELLNHCELKLLESSATTKVELAQLDSQQMNSSLADKATPTAPPPTRGKEQEKFFSYKCLFCDKSSFPSAASVKSHMSCVHAWQHLYILEPSDISEHEVDLSIADIYKESICLASASSAPGLGQQRGEYHCFICGGGGTGCWKCHLMEIHSAHVLSKIRTMRKSNSVDAAGFHHQHHHGVVDQGVIINPAEEYADIALDLSATSEVAAAAAPGASSSGNNPAQSNEQTEQRGHHHHNRIHPYRKITHNARIFQRDRHLFQSSDQKPLLSYTFLIRQAIVESPKGQLTLHEIYTWMETNFGYFRLPAGETGNWRNCVRHTLSVKDCFLRVGVEGNRKNGLWRVNDEVEVFDNKQ